MAAAAGVAPSQLCSDFALWEMVRRRPGAPAALATCQGCSELFVQRHGQVRQIMPPCLLCSNATSAVACTSEAPGKSAVRLSSGMWRFSRCLGRPGPPAVLQAFVQAIVGFCKTSELLDIGDPSQQQQQQQSQAGGSQGARRRSAHISGAACSQAAACLSEPKARLHQQRAGSWASLVTALLLMAVGQ